MCQPPLSYFTGPGSSHIVPLLGPIHAPINSPERVFWQGSVLPPAVVDGNSIAHVIRKHEPVPRGSGPLLWVVHTPTIIQLLLPLMHFDNWEHIFPGPAME